MYINKKNYWLELGYLDKILKKAILKSRINIFKIFLENVKFDKNTKILDVGTTPILDSHENIIFHQYKWRNNITGFSNQNCSLLNKKFKFNKFIRGDATNIKLKKIYLIYLFVLQPLSMLVVIKIKRNLFQNYLEFQKIMFF